MAPTVKSCIYQTLREIENGVSAANLENGKMHPLATATTARAQESSYQEYGGGSGVAQEASKPAQPRC